MPNTTLRSLISTIIILPIILHLQACAVITVADAVVTTTVKVGAAAVGTAVGVTRAGVGMVTSVVK
ncbi:MAG: hypothetical protein RIS97_975 [Pseudomonadota bacterium]|jgi:hypothetical protein